MSPDSNPEMPTYFLTYGFEAGLLLCLKAEVQGDHCPHGEEREWLREPSKALSPKTLA